MKQTLELTLASTSPRRREILQSLGLRFDVEAVAVDEQRRGAESPDRMVRRLAEAKVTAAQSAGVVLAADTIVVLGDRVLGKPANADDAVAMLLALSAETHVVITGVAMRSAAGLRAAQSATKVRFREISRDEALRYWQSGEPCDKAGAYGIQGLGGMFVEAIEGSYSGVMGLPVFETVELLKSAGIEVLMDRK